MNPYLRSSAFASNRDMERVNTSFPFAFHLFALRPDAPSSVVCFKFAMRSTSFCTGRANQP